MFGFRDKHKPRPTRSPGRPSIDVFVKYEHKKEEIDSLRKALDEVTKELEQVECDKPKRLTLAYYKEVVPLLWKYRGLNVDLVELQDDVINIFIEAEMYRRGLK